MGENYMLSEVLYYHSSGSHKLRSCRKDVVGFGATGGIEG